MENIISVEISEKNSITEKSKIAWSVPLERLYVIGKVNTKKFLDKWEKGIEKGLLPPDNFNTYHYSADVIKGIGRILGTAGILFITIFSDADNSETTGAMLTAIFPLLELASSGLDEIYENKKSKWENFTKDTENIWDNCQELIGIIKTSQDSCLNKEQANKIFEKLNTEIYELLKGCDKNKNRKIETSELETSKEEFTKDLCHNWKERKENLEKVMREIKKLEEKLIHYRQEIFSDEEKADEEVNSNSFISSQISLLDNFDEQSPSSEEIIEMQNLEQEAKIQQKEPYGILSSSKNN